MTSIWDSVKQEFKEWIISHSKPHSFPNFQPDYISFKLDQYWYDIPLKHLPQKYIELIKITQDLSSTH